MGKGRAGRVDGHCWTYLRYWEPSLAGERDGKLKKLGRTGARAVTVAGHQAAPFSKAHDCPARDYSSPPMGCERKSCVKPQDPVLKKQFSFSPSVGWM